MAGIEDVAKLAGVSTATVSRALTGKDHVSDKSKAKVLQAAKELGYVASSSAYTLATGRTRNIGVVLPYVDRWFFSAMLEAIDTTFSEHGYDLTLYNLSGGEKHRERIFSDFLLRKRVDAVLTVAVALSDSEIEYLNRVKKPILVIGGIINGVHSRRVNDSTAAQLATNHLISLGHKKIANISGLPQSDLEFDQPNIRRQGYLEAIAEAGIEPPLEHWLAQADYTLEGAYHAAKQILGNPKDAPTAIFCNSDEMGFGAILAARDLGLRVPDDVSIIGFDNHDNAEFFGLTTVDQRVREQGRAAALSMVEILAEQHPDEVNFSDVVEWPVELKIRSSTARPRN
jgi:DNA-binding LacI/PurR family transcriptional regulator